TGKAARAAELQPAEPRMIAAVVRWFAGFFEAHAPQSMSRAVALLCSLAGVAIAAVACVLAWRNPTATSTPELLRAFGTLAAVFIVSGAVAILTRTKPNDLLPAPTTAAAT